VDKAMGAQYSNAVTNSEKAGRSCIVKTPN